jgi:hypothetical protein
VAYFLFAEETIIKSDANAYCSAVGKYVCYQNDGATSIAMKWWREDST